ncbi:low choriolytic enzyme-like [Micropterus salmoides]|uniref:low choriolytic enzyme-like n=1 Tax=Micropterus salmoides TaxID=27706 RepID=UPI0018EAD0A5|nr:low choriolytic enzyme-like [Micropterus salmoides]
MDLRTTVSLLLLLLGLCKAHSEDISTTILRMNSEYSEFLLEGDVMIPKTRNAMKCLQGANSCLWPKSANGKVEIPFIISDAYENTERNTIVQAMKGIESKTCISFIPQSTETSYLSIESMNGCASLVGRTGGKQLVSMQRSGCLQNGIIQHELLHALGFYHEHTRSDRDQHVTINWQNILNGLAYNFQKKDTNNLNTMYDYSSIMHYGRTAFGNNGLETITPIPDASVSIGQRVGLSTIDILKINKLYNC